MGKQKMTISNPTDAKLDEIIKLMQLSICLSLQEAGVNQGQIAKTLGVAKEKVNKMLSGIVKIIDGCRDKPVFLTVFIYEILKIKKEGSRPQKKPTMNVFRLRVTRRL